MMTHKDRGMKTQKRVFVDQNHGAASDDHSGSESLPFKTIGAAVARLKPGDTLLIKAGRYPEEVVLDRAGNLADGPIVVEAFGEDRVELVGTARVGEAGWTPRGDGIYACALPAGFVPAACEGRGLQPRAFCNRTEIPLRSQLGVSQEFTGQGIGDVDLPVGDDDPRFCHTAVTWFEIEPSTGELRIQCPNGDPNALEIELSVRKVAVHVTAPCVRVSGLHIYGYFGVGLLIAAPHVEIEYNRLDNNATGIRLACDDAHESIVRRNTVMRCGCTGIHFQTNGAIIEDNSVVGSCANSVRNDWSGGLKTNSGSFNLVRNNVVVNTGINRVPGSCNAWGSLWGDLFAKSNILSGNTVHGNEWVGIYVEFGQDGTRIAYNASSENLYGLCFRRAMHNVAVHNVLIANRKSLGFFSPMTMDNFIKDNLFAGKGAALGREFAQETEKRAQYRNVLDDNVWDRAHDWAEFDAYQGAYGREIRREIKDDPTPEDVGLDVVTLRNPFSVGNETMAMVGNRHTCLVEPFNDHLPYFFRPALLGIEVSSGTLRRPFLSGRPCFAHVYEGRNFLKEYIGEAAFGLLQREALVSYKLEGAGVAFHLQGAESWEGGDAWLGVRREKGAALAPHGWTTPSLPIRAGNRVRVSCLVELLATDPSLRSPAPVVAVEWIGDTGQKRRCDTVAAPDGGYVAGAAIPVRATFAAPDDFGSDLRFNLFLGLDGSECRVARFTDIVIEDVGRDS